jgi:Alginate export
VGFWGVYVTRPVPHKDLLEMYYLGLDRKDATFQRGTAHELRHTLGARFSRPIATQHPGLDFDDEALWQFGSFGSANIQAWTVATETGYRLPTVALKPRFSLKADISCGDQPASNTPEASCARSRHTSSPASHLSPHSNSGLNLPSPIIPPQRSDFRKAIIRLETAKGRHEIVDFAGGRALARFQVTLNA